MLERDAILEKLRSAGIEVDADTLQVESRKGRTVARLDDRRIAWFPEHAEGRAAIANERRILRLIEENCRYLAPRILYAHADGWDVREMVAGVPAPDFLEQVRNDPVAARQTGGALGGILADQHTLIHASELEGWLPRVGPWPADADLANLPRVVDDLALLARIGRALELRTAMMNALIDPVLVHGDLGPWNLACDPRTGAVNGVFDYGDACLGDRHQDFRYMLFHREDEQVMLEAAIAAYEGETGTRLDRRRIGFFNAVEAIAFLAFRVGHAPEERWCGRTLAEDLAWADTALRSVDL